MAFSAIAGGLASGVGSSILGGGGGGKKGAGGSSTGGNTFSQTQNFAPFQADAIGQVFDILGGGGASDLLLGGTDRDSLLETPRLASDSLTNALDFSNSLLAGTDQGSQGLRNFESLLNDQFSRQPFASTIGDIGDLRDSAEASFAPLINRAVSLSDEGINPRFGNLLEGIANEDPFSNPFVDQLVSDVGTDVRNAVLDQAGPAGLESSGIQQAALREQARSATDIRGRFGESSRNRSLSAAQAGASFDAANASQRLNALLGGGSLTSQSLNAQLAAQNQINNLTVAEENRRGNLLGQRLATNQTLAQLPIQGLNAIGPLAQQFTELPFVPLSNFNSLAANPNLFRTTVGNNTTQQNPSLFDTLGQAASLGLTGAGILDSTGIFGSGTSFSPNAGGIPNIFTGGTQLTGLGSIPANTTLGFPGGTPSFSGFLGV